MEIVGENLELGLKREGILLVGMEQKTTTMMMRGRGQEE